MNSHNQPLKLKTIAAATSNELRALSLIAVKLQDVFANITDVQPIATYNSLNDIQDLDYLTQSLVALTGFWETLADDTPGSWQYPTKTAAHNITLKDLAARLSGHESNEGITAQHSNGFCDLF